MNASRLDLEGAFDILLVVIGIGIAYLSWSYGFGSLSRPGPGLYPFCVGIAIAAFASLTLIAHVKTRPATVRLASGTRNTFLIMTGTFCLWIVAMPFLGYVAVTLIATYAFCKAMRLEGWRKPLAVSGGTALFIYVLFDYWLYIDLPRGIFS